MYTFTLINLTTESRVIMTIVYSSLFMSDISQYFATEYMIVSVAGVSARGGREGDSGYKCQGV